MINKKSIVITGGIGFIGFALAKALTKKKYKIYIIDVWDKKRIQPKKLEFINDFKISYIRHNLTTKLKHKIKNVGYIFHTAGLLGVKFVENNPFQCFINNTECLKNVIKIAENNKNCKILNFSTSEVYANSIKNSENFPTPEDIDLIVKGKVSNRDSYALSKIFCEKLLELSNLNYINLRPHNIYGPNMGVRHVIPELIIKMKKLNKVKIISSHQSRCFCYINDAVDQILRISFSKLNKMTFNIGNPYEEITIKKLSLKIFKIVDKKNLSLFFSNNNTKGSPQRRKPSIKKFKKYLVKKNFVSLNDGLKLTFNWYNKKQII